MTEQLTEPLLKGTGYANLTDDNSFKGEISVYDHWVHIKTPKGEYTKPRSDIDFINWKEV